MLTASIIVPTYNRADLLKLALESIQQLRVPEGMKVNILVVDNKSTDHTATVTKESVQAGPLPVRRVVEERQGLNFARNRALLECDGEWAIFLDDDILVDPGWLETFKQTVETMQPDAVAGGIEPWYEEDPQAFDYLTPVILRSVTSHHAQVATETKLLPAEDAHLIIGCNFAVRRIAALEAGGFHPALDRSGNQMLGGGDTEFGEKLGLLGKRVIYEPACRVKHHISRAKISREGLRKRTSGTGATARTLMRLRGKTLPARSFIRFNLRMIRFALYTLREKLAGNTALAFEWELKTRRLFAYLYKGLNLPPRSWPPEPLKDERPTQ